MKLTDNFFKFSIQRELEVIICRRKQILCSPIFYAQYSEIGYVLRIWSYVAHFIIIASERPLAERIGPTDQPNFDSKMSVSVLWRKRFVTDDSNLLLADRDGSIKRTENGLGDDPVLQHVSGQCGVCRMVCV